jgi:plastocyanin
MNNFRKILSLIIASTILSSVLAFQLNSVQSQPPQQQQPHSDIDSTPIAAVITITNDKDGNTVFNPQVTTIKQDQEILVLNNDTVAHSFTNGENPDDPMAGKIFDSGQIQPKGFIEYVATNLSPGNYTFYTITEPTVTAQISILQK